MLHLLADFASTLGCLATVALLVCVCVCVCTHTQGINRKEGMCLNKEMQTVINVEKEVSER